MDSPSRAPHPATLSHAERRAPSQPRATKSSAAEPTKKAAASAARTAPRATFDETLRALIDGVASLGASAKSASTLYLALKQAGYGSYLGAQKNIAHLFEARRAPSSLGVGVASRGRSRGSAVFAVVATRESRVSDDDELVFLSLTPERADAASAQLVQRKTPSSPQTTAERLYVSAGSMRQASEILERAGLVAPPWASTPQRLRTWVQLMAAIQAAC